jgi:class 3 adenylate cyclase
LDLASEALAADSSLDDAAAVVGVARHRLSVLNARSVELRQLTIVAVDMCASTAIAAAVGPERFRELMMDLYAACVEALTRYDGRVLKFNGDGVLAEFGHPVAHEDDGRRAALGALAVVDGVERRRERWEKRFGTRVAVRVGIDTGTVAVGPMDASPWSADEVAGDPPNIASRVQAVADPMSVWVTDATRQLIAGWFDTEPIGPVKLRNYPRPVNLHRVRRPTEAENRLEASVRSRPALVNRSSELEVFRSAWNHVSDTGERRVIAITGPAGIGKSRLVEHVIGTAVAAGATPITLACSPLYRASPLRPVARALRRQFRIAPGEETSDALVLAAIRRQLDQLPSRRVPTEDAARVFAWLLGRSTFIDLQPEALRRRAFDALIDLFEALAAGNPVVILVDDADAADPSTAELLAALLARPVTTSMLVILAGRALPDVGECDAVIELAGLTDGDAGRLARSVAPDLDDDTIGRIVERCDGVPFYIEELARAATENRGDVASEVVELSAFVAARLDELGVRLRQLVALVAIAGREVRLDVLARLSTLSPARLDAQVAELAARGVLRRGRDARGELVRFRHDVIREAAYRTLLTTHRAEQHLRLAQILAELPPDSIRPDDLGAHYTLGGDHASALRCWLRAARQATITGARSEAIELFRYALTAIARLPASAELTGAELEAQFGLGAALSVTHGYTSSQARAAFQRAMELAEALDDSTAIWPALWGIWSYWFVLGEHQTAAVLAERCLSIAEHDPHDSRFRSATAAIIGYQRLYLGDFVGAHDELELAARHVGAEPLPELPQDPAIISNATLSVALWFLGEHDRSAAVAQMAWEQAQRMEDINPRAGLTRAWVACKLAWRAELAGDPRGALQLSELAAAISARHGYATWLANATLHRAIALCALGRTGEGLPLLTKMVDAWQGLGRDPEGHQRHPVLMTPYFAGRLAQARQSAGDLDGAAAVVAEQLAATEASGEHFWDAALRELQKTLPNPKDRA